jgi:hypothetical protein
VSDSRDRYERFRKQYPIDSELSVRYHPDHPQKAVLVPGVSRHCLMALGLGIGVFGIGLWVLLWLYERLG